MCVNFTPIERTTLGELVKSERVPEYRPETFPGYAAPMIRAGDAGNLQADLGLFGLLPAWAKDRAFGKRTYNARTETVAEKPSYRTAWAKKQFCLIPMERFFEPCWETGKAVRWSIHRVVKRELTDEAKPDRNCIMKWVKTAKASIKVLGLGRTL